MRVLIGMCVVLFLFGIILGGCGSFGQTAEATQQNDVIVAASGSN